MKGHINILGDDAGLLVWTQKDWPTPPGRGGRLYRIEGDDLIVLDERDAGDARSNYLERGNEVCRDVGGNIWRCWDTSGRSHDIDRKHRHSGVGDCMAWTDDVCTLWPGLFRTSSGIEVPIAPEDRLTSWNHILLDLDHLRVLHDDHYVDYSAEGRLVHAWF